LEKMDLQTLASAFIKELGKYSYKPDGMDQVWEVLFPDKENKWNFLYIRKYENAFYITHINGAGRPLRMGPRNHLQEVDTLGARMPKLDMDGITEIWGPLFTDARKWLDVVRRDWMKAYSRLVAEFPLNLRYGIVSNAILRANGPHIYHLDKQVGRKNAEAFLRIVESGYFEKSDLMMVRSMNADCYFKYCRIAYIAGKRKEDVLDRKLSGREMYKKYADGRHDGLLDISPSSKKAFADWIDGKHPKRTHGGHPWEIKRGGSETHIDLSVYSPSGYPKSC
jgi:hypothetical protein